MIPQKRQQNEFGDYGYQRNIPEKETSFNMVYRQSKDRLSYDHKPQSVMSNDQSSFIASNEKEQREAELNQRYVHTGNGFANYHEQQQQMHIEGNRRVAP